MPKYCKIYVKNRYIKDCYKNCSQKLRLSAKPKLQKKDCAKNCIMKDCVMLAKFTLFPNVVLILLNLFWL